MNNKKLAFIGFIILAIIFAGLLILAIGRDMNDNSSSNNNDTELQNLGSEEVRNILSPAQSFQDTRNAQRSSDVIQILNAVTMYTSDQDQTLQSLAKEATSHWEYPMSSFPLCGKASLSIGKGVTEVDLDSILAPTYIVAIPSDPIADFESGKTGYTICEDPSGRVTISAPFAEETDISVSR